MNRFNRTISNQLKTTITTDNSAEQQKSYKCKFATSVKQLQLIQPKLTIKVPKEYRTSTNDFKNMPPTLEIHFVHHAVGIDNSNDKLNIYP